MRTEASWEKPPSGSQCAIARQQAAAHEAAQQPPAHALLHFGEGWRIEPGGGMEEDPPEAAESNTPSTIERPFSPTTRADRCAVDAAERRSLMS